MSEFHLAQINIAQAKFDLEAPEMSGFTNRLDKINSIADKSEGFVWRLQTEEGDATSLRVFPDPKMIVNLSVWKNFDTLKAFIYQSSHIEVMRGKVNWFNTLDNAHLALWWIAAGHIPTIEEAQERLEFINQHGATPKAFSFAANFPATTD